MPARTLTFYHSNQGYPQKLGRDLDFLLVKSVEHVVESRIYVCQSVSDRSLNGSQPTKVNAAVIDNTELKSAQIEKKRSLYHQHYTEIKV